MSVPNRKVRNQPANRIHDIEFATEISTSLIAQVRNLQALLAEKEEELRDIKVDKSKLEYETENFQQRVKSLDESENRYKDENWNLETQLQQLMAAQREASDREKRLQQNLNVLQAEKNATQRELDEAKLNHAKLAEEHAAIVKQHDIELGTAKRTLVMADTDKATLRKKIDDLTGQNTELAKAFSSTRGRTIEREPLPGMSEDDFDTANDNMTPDHSPPGSPVKGTTPRHSMLETETLKTSLGHAQRTIQSLRTNYHREKTEKMELRRMLQDARDDLEKSRQEAPPSVTKRARKTESREFKKPPRLLGGLRTARSEIFTTDDPNWEDQDGEQHSPSLTASMSSSMRTLRLPPFMEQDSDQFETANDASDAAFETANERVTDTDFHTGHEEFSSDDAQTETESPSKRPTTSKTRPVAGLLRSDSLLSSASTEDDEYPFESDPRNSNVFPPFQARFPLRVSRGANRRSRYASEEPNLQSSPASLVASSTRGTPNHTPSQSLAAELGDFDGSDDESQLSATPSRRSLRARTASPPPSLPPLPRLPMVDSGTMTDSLDSQWDQRPLSMATENSRLSMATFSDASTQDLHENIDKFPVPPSAERSPGVGLGISGARSVSVESLQQSDAHTAELAALKDEHAGQVETLQAEHAAAIATALAALRAEHGAEIESLAQKNTESQAQAALDLHSSHAAQLAQAEAAIRQEHAEQMTKMTAEHKKEAEVAAAAAAALLAKELATVRSAHSDELSSKLSERDAAHASSSDAMKASHSEALALSAAERQNEHDRNVGALKSSHAQELERREAELKQSFDNTLGALRAQHEEERSSAKRESDAAQLAAIAALTATHAKQTEDVRREMADSAANELSKLKASHEVELKHAKDESAAALSSQIEHAKQSHAQQIEELQSSLGSQHSEQLEVLKQSHVKDLDELKTSLATAHAHEIEELKDAHAAALEQLKHTLTSTHAQVSKDLADGHARDLEASRTAHDQALEDVKGAHRMELESHQAQHQQSIGEVSKKHTELHTAALAALTAAHAKEMASTRSDGDNAVAALAAAHAKELAMGKSESDKKMAALTAAHAAELNSATSEHQAALSSLSAAHAQELRAIRTEGDEALAREVAILKDAHSTTIDSLKAQHAAAQAAELEKFKSALAKHVESSKAEGNAAHSEQLEALNAANAQIIDAHKRESEQAQIQALDQLRTSHERFVNELKQAHAAQLTQETESLVSAHAREMESAAREGSQTNAVVVEDLKREHAMVLAGEMDRLATEHAQQLAEQHAVAEQSRAKAIDDLAVSHSQILADLRSSHDQSKSQELEEIKATHEQLLEQLKAEHELSKNKLSEKMTASHQQALTRHRGESDDSKSAELAALALLHAKALEDLKAASSSSNAEQTAALRQEHEAALAQELDALRSKLQAEHSEALESLLSENGSSHAAQLAALREQHAASHAQEMDALRSKIQGEHAQALELQRTEQETGRTTELAAALAEQKAAHERDMQAHRDQSASTHAQTLQALQDEHDSAMTRGLREVEDRHNSALTVLKSEHQSALTAALDKLRQEHATALEQLGHENTVKLADATEGLGASHVKHVEDLASKHELALAQEIDALKAEHSRALRSHEQRSAADLEALMRAHASELAALRQSLTIKPAALAFSALSVVETEPVDGADLRSPKREAFIIPRDPFLNGPAQRVSQEGPTSPRSMVSDVGSTATVRIRRSQESLSGSSKWQRIVDPVASPPAQEASPVRRPSSAASGRGSIQDLPPLPANHREVIEAARTQSSGGGKGNMGPPLIPASAYRPTSSSRPRTPGNQRPMSAQSTGSAILRTGVASGEVQSPQRLPPRSRQSSVSSFASEIDNRFNIRAGMGMDAAGFGPNTDPRMIQAITQTMIGEYLWKYTRKAGRGEMSGNRHRRYFWVHPYTRTLYWGDRDPSAAGRSELRAKSVPIEAVRVVSDDNPMPPGLHRKSLIVISPGRTVKFTCTTGQRHETWFNALSYLLLRTGTENQTDVEDIAGQITQEDVDEFNPSANRRAANGARPRAPASLSSYNSRTTRGTDSPQMEMSMSIPTLTPTHERGLARPGTLSRLSGYFKSSTNSINTFSSRRGRGHAMPDSAIYEASEVHDSAEDLRQIIEQQDRESDRLENVRACCDGKSFHI